MTIMIYLFSRFFYCGPDRNNACKVGARTVAPCGHSATVLLAGCVLPGNPVCIQSCIVLHKYYASVDCCQSGLVDF